MKKTLLLLAPLSLFAVGAVQFELVAQEPDDEHEDVRYSQEEELAGRIADFADRLAIEESPLLERLKDALETEAGKIAFEHHVAEQTESLRREAMKTAWDVFVADNFEYDEEKGLYLAKEIGTEQTRTQTDRGDRPSGTAILPSVADLRSSWQEAKKDISRIRSVFEEYAPKLVEEDEATGLLARFLRHEDSATVFYFMEIAERVRPGLEAVERELGRVFVRRGQGYYIPDSNLERAKELFERIELQAEGAEAIAAELKIFATELATTDEFHQRIHDAFLDPVFAAVLSWDRLHDADPEELDTEVAEMLERLDWAFVDTARGLEINPEEHEHASELLEDYERAKQAIDVVARHVERIRNSASAPNHEWLDLLSNPVVLVRIAAELDVDEPDAGKVTKELLDEIVTPVEQQPVRYVVREEVEENAVEHLREMFRIHREVRRRTRPMAKFAEQLSNDQEIFRELGGRAMVLLGIRRRVEAATYDGFEAWIEERFAETEAGYVLRDDFEEVIEEILEATDEIREELENDDF